MILPWWLWLIGGSGAAVLLYVAVVIWRESRDAAYR